MEVFVGLMLGNYIEELSFLAVEVFILSVNVLFLSDLQLVNHESEYWEYSE